MLWHELETDLQEYLGLSAEVLQERLVQSHQAVVDHWRKDAPESREEREAFYVKTDTYLLELAAWILQFSGRADWNAQVHEFAKTLKLKTALDFGAGISNEGLQLAADGLSVDICEVSPASRNFALWRAKKRGLALNLVDADKLGRYDLCVCLDVIGHVEEPVELVIQLARHAQYMFYTPDFQLPPPQNYWPMHAEKPANFDQVFNAIWKPLHGGFYESRLYRPKFAISPTLKDFSSGEGGVKRQIEALYKLLPQFGIDVDDQNGDFAHSHATGNDPRTLVYTSHGFYPWATTNKGEQQINAILKQSIAAAKRVISVSDEAKTIIETKLNTPVTVIRNGVFLDQLDAVQAGEFRHRYKIPDGPFFLWSKNSIEGVCDPTPAIELARLMPQYTFVFTMVNNAKLPKNARVVGLLAHPRMLEAVADCAVYLGTTKEQFSVGTLEAMGLGKPTLCFSEGGNGKVIEHQKDGYIASELDLPDLVKGAQYCLKNAERLGKSARKKVEREYTWERLVAQIVEVYWGAIDAWLEDLKRPLVSIVIPHYNLAKYLPEAIDAAIAQTVQSKEVIVIDDGSTQDISAIVRDYTPLGVRFLRQDNAGVSAARNRGIAASAGRYICCLDADDRIDPRFAEKLIATLEPDRRVGLAYTDFSLFGDALGRMRGIDYDFNRLKEGNFIPCCNVFRREAWVRTGGYKNINPSWEDYELWLNMGKLGFVGKHLAEPLFFYRKRNQQGRDFFSHGHEARLRALVNSYHPDLYVPKLSVVIPTYKHTHFLPEVLESLRLQSFHDFEALIVDDGNDDGDKIEEVAQRFAAEFPVRVIHHDRNRGLATARNTGVENARGMYILTLDADDIIKPLFMEKTVEVLDERPDIAIVYTDIETFGSVNRVMEMPDYDFDLLLQKNLMACASPYRREVWEKVGGYKTDMVWGWEDYDFWISAGRLGFCGVRIPEPLFLYRRVGETMILRAQNHVSEMRRQLREHNPDVFRGERPMACCGKTRLTHPSVGLKKGFIASNPVVGEYQLIRVHYKSSRPLRVRTAVTGTYYTLTDKQSIWVDPRDVPQLLSRGDFEYAMDEELEEVPV